MSCTQYSFLADMGMLLLCQKEFGGETGAESRGDCGSKDRKGKDQHDVSCFPQLQQHLQSHVLYCSLQQAAWAISPPTVACCCEEWLSLSASVATPHGGYDLVPIQITDWKSHAGLVSNSTWMLDVCRI